MTAIHINDLAAWCNIAFSDDSNPLSYAHHLFLNGEEIKDLVISNNVKNIGNRAFSGCTSLSSVTIGNSVISIGHHAFSGCIGLSSVKIDNNVISIGHHAFSSCSGLSSVTIGNSVKSIGNNAFYYCKGLSSVTIGNGVTNIGEDAFNGCSALTSVHINDLEAWCNIAFSNVNSNPLSYARHLFLNGEEIKDLTIPNSVKNIGVFTFAYCSGLTSITIPSSVMSIGEGAFGNCTGLTSVKIPNSVTNLKDMVFFGCTSLTTITIGSGVKSIGSSAFALCVNLKDVYCMVEETSSTSLKTHLNTSRDAFASSYVEYATLHVSESSINAYKTTEPWNRFKEIVALTDQELSIDGITANNKTELARYTLSGQHANKGTKGLNIVRMSDGTTKKVVVK